MWVRRSWVGSVGPMRVAAHVQLCESPRSAMSTRLAKGWLLRSALPAYALVLLTIGLSLLIGGVPACAARQPLLRLLRGNVIRKRPTAVAAPGRRSAGARSGGMCNHRVGSVGGGLQWMGPLAKDWAAGGIIRCNPLPAFLAPSGLAPVSIQVDAPDPALHLDCDRRGVSGHRATVHPA